MPIDEALLQRAVDKALELGADYAEARYHLNKVDSIAVRNGRVIGAEVSEKEGVGVRVVVGGALGFAATNKLEWGPIEAAVKAAVERARAVAPYMRDPIRFSDERVGRARYSVAVRKPLDDFRLEDAVELAKETFSNTTEAVGGLKVPVSMFFVEKFLEEKTIINSDGALIQSSVPRILVYVNTVIAGEKGSIQRFREFGASGGAELIDEWDIPTEVSEEAARLAKVLTEGKEPPKEAVPVVVGQEVVGLLVHESCGHPMEADRILGREAAQAGESYVKPDMIGKYRVGTELVTVIDDPTIPGSNGFYLFDEEGVPARPRYLYLRGVLNEPLHNRHTAAIFGTRSNAAARAMDYKSEPIIRMANTYFAPGDVSFAELIEDIRYGVYIKSYQEWNIDDIRWNQRYVGLEAYITRDGELAEPVRNPVLEITTKGFYSRVVGVDKELMFFPGTCGKGEPSQGVPVWFGGPNVRLEPIKLGVMPA